MREILVAAPTELGLVTDKGFRVLDTDEMMGAQAAGIERGDVLVSIAGVSMRAIAQVGPQALLTPLPAPPTPLPVVRRAAVPGRTIPLPAGQEEPYVPTPAERADTAVMNFVRALLVQSNGQPVPVVIRRGNQQLTLQVTPGPIIPAPGKPRPTPVFAGRGLYYF